MALNGPWLKLASVVRIPRPKSHVFLEVYRMTYLFHQLQFDEELMEAKSRRITNDGFPCQWGSCSSTFLLESELFSHLKAHTKVSRKHPCNWKGCPSTTVYTNVGYLNDHLIAHLSSSFLSVWCVKCRAGFRNRQCLSRHQKKTGCKGSCRVRPTLRGDSSLSAESCRVCGESSFRLDVKAAKYRCAHCKTLKYVYDCLIFVIDRRRHHLPFLFHE
jgi:hypothetical protein